MTPETEGTMEPTAEPGEISLEVVPVAPLNKRQATLDDAFMLLCAAIAAELEDDLPGVTHAEEIVGWYTNGNTAIAWQHAVMLLETTIGVPLRGGN